MDKIFRVMGNRGRATIPYSIRLCQKFYRNTILSYEPQGEDAVIVRREKICDDCQTIDPDPQIMSNGVSINDFLDSLSEKDQFNALVYLNLKWAKQKGVTNL